MTPAVQIVDPRSDPVPAGWAEFRERRQLHPFWDYDLLRLEAWMARNPPLLAVVRDGADVVGALCALVCRTWRLGDYATAPGKHTRSTRPRWAEVFVPLFSGHPACVFAPRLGLPARVAAVRAFERELVRYLGFGLLGVLYRAMTEELVPAITGPGRPHRTIDPVAVLVNEWSTVDDPAAGRPAGGVDRTLVVRSGAGRDDLDAAELAALLNRQRAHDDALAWAGGQRRRFGGLVQLDTRSQVASAYLDRFVRRPEVDTLTYHDADGMLVAFNTLIDHPDSADVYHWAVAPDRADAADCYARRARYMIEHGRRELTAGRGLLEVKERLGFGTRVLHTVAAPRPVLGRA
ncbi:MAG: hypothetical protein GEV28_20670 [Actinophytocola sp.]|uniref:hypothetical protein n=1 Tax=Actinophytocola sp. TaxID=1872138 RepID=UPI00132CBBE5|nr:hypothetical protein [Actinophytocola sp.]MPZ82680.1 hypothetical protein [Actinophytocola sp.]